MRVLLVTYHFPPDAEIGGIRPYRLARHLPEHGIEPWVLTVRPEFAETLDPLLGHEGVPAERIVRTGVNRTPRDQLLDAWRQAASRTVPPESPGARRRDPVGGSWSLSPPGLLDRARRRALVWLALPDLQIGWYRPAVQAGDELLRRHSFDAIVSTSPPRVAHLVGARLSERHRQPWVMDFRDPWYMGWGTPGGDPVAIRAFQDWLFRRTARRANAVVANTPRLLEHLRERLSARPSKAVCIPNGFDLGMTGDASERPDRFTIGYFGQIMGHRSAVPFLRGLRLWLDCRRIQPDRIQVRFAGQGFGVAQRAAQNLGIESMVSFDPRVPRETALQMMGQQWVLLLLANGQPLQIPGKAYEYLATGRRVLAVTERAGATADFLQGVPGCAVAESPEEIANALDRFWSEFTSGGAGRFDRHALFAEGTHEHRASAFAGLLREIRSFR